MRLLIATDAWHPQVNGVVTTLARMHDELPQLGVEVAYLTPENFKTLPMPGYSTIRLALATASRIASHVEAFRPDWIHIATEGPIGWSARRFCLRTLRPFTTSYHTKFPEYANRIAALPSSWVYALERLFHKNSSGVMVATASLEDDLRTRGFHRLMRWSRGVDLSIFHPRPVRHFGDGPVFLYVGRVSREKNIEAFLDADIRGRKVVVGDGPHLQSLRRRYRDVWFTGAKCGVDLAEQYASADVFVFPSRTDTFGLVMLEAMASGLPVAAYPVTGPIDVVENGASGILSEDLGKAAQAALLLDRAAARSRAAKFAWSQSARQFLENIQTAKSQAENAHGRGADSSAARAAPHSQYASITQGHIT
ncbi:MAG: glycosyltransferase family 1 protein [Hyphomicrobiaceae bacterium]|nr:glycosyltransferase family 1 protein [Hyphomicrobiaceae bacterium]